MATVGVVFRPKPPSLVIKGEKGRGSYGAVCHGELKGKPVMIKRIHKILLTSSRSDQLRKFEQECQILETLHHPNIVHSLGAFWDEATREPLLVMEPMKENLRDYLERRKQADTKLSVDDHLSIALSIADGLKFLHEQKQPIAHRDLNDKNILVGEDGSVKIGDFGQSTLLAGSTEYMGTKAPGAFVFMPPEALMDEPHYNLKVDSFSMGVLMLEISTQMPPPARMSNIGSSQEVERRSKDLTLLDSCHPLKPLIIWCLQNQYKLRPDVATIHSQLMTLKHPELQQKVEELQTGLREAELHLLQLEGTLQKSNEQMEVLKGDNKKLETELEVTKEKVLKQTLDLEEQNYTLEQLKNENKQLEGQLKSSRDRESHLMLQLRQTERTLGMASYARDSLRKLQEIKTADGRSNPRCVAALYCIPMPGTVSKSSAAVFLQRTLRGDNPVVDVHILKHFSTSQQSLVLLEALKFSPSDDVTTLVEQRKGEMECKLLMTEICSITFTSPENCDVINTACAILAMDPELADCKVVIMSDHEKNKISITGSWRAISQLRKQLMAVFCTATEKQQPLVGDAVKSLVDSVIRGESRQEETEAKDAENVTSTANATQNTRNVPPSKHGGYNPRCVAALYCIPMPGTVNECSAKVLLQRTLRGDNPVVNVHILKHFCTSQQSLVLLEALKSSPSDDVTTLVKQRKGEVDFKLLMTEMCSVTFISPENCDVINAACAILVMDPELVDCKVFMTSDSAKNKVSITGSWRAISQLRKQLMAVFCTATEKQQLLVGDVVESLVDSVIRGESTQEGKEAKDAENVTSTANATQNTRNVPPSKHDVSSVPDNQSLVVDSFTSLNPATVQLMRRLKLFDATYIQCSEDFTTVNVVRDKEAATKAGDVFVNLYQALILGHKIITEIVHTNNLPEDQYALLLSEIEAQHPEVLCQAQYSQQSMVLSALEQPKLMKAKQHIVSYSPGKQLPAMPPRPTHTTPQPTSLRDASLLLPNGGMLTVKRGDLLKEKVTAIVNAANDRLDHIGGVAFAIDRASDGNVQRESRKVIQKRGRVPTGQVAVTGAGGHLQCQSVIHAVGPDANERPHKECEQLLKLVCENVLRTAEAQGMTSVALPAISSGIYAMKKDMVAQILISTILHYPYQHSSPLKDIRIVLFDEETLRPFRQFASQVKQRMPPGTAQRVIPVARSPDVVEIPLEKTHRKMVIKKAHFLYEDADIKVAAICSELGFGTGYSKELDGHLKGKLSEAVRVRYQYRRPDRFDVFTVHVQHASINCRYLVIVNILDRSLGTCHDAHKCLQQILQAVCQEADTLEMPSVAISPKTFAVGGFQLECVLPEFIHMLHQFKFTNQDFLTDVRFLALDPDTFDILIAGAERAIGRPLKQPPKHTQAPQTPQQPHQPGTAGDRSNMSGHQISKEVTYRPDGAADHVGQGTPDTGQPPTQANPEEVQQHASSTFVVSNDVVEIPLEKTHRKMVIKKAHFIYEDADIKVAAICSELGFATGSNKELDGHLKGQLSEAVQVRYQYRRPDRFDVFTVHVQHATFGCRYLVIVNILDRSLGTRQDAHKYLQQILQTVCQEADTLEMPSVVIAPSTFSIGGFQSGSILPAFIRMINDFKFTNDDFLTDVRFLALDQNSFSILVAGAERHIGKSLRKPVQGSSSTGSSLSTDSHLHSTDTAGASEHNSQKHSIFSQVQTSTPHSFGFGSHQTGHSVGVSTTGSADTRSIPSVSIPFHHGRNLTVRKGDLVEEAVEAIVNSTDEHLQHSSGVAKTINEASGGTVQMALNDVVARMGGGAQSGRVVVTAAGGSLRCKHVIHAVWPVARERPNKGYERLLKEICQEVINIAEERQMKSIALPPMRSGSCELSKEVIAQIIIDSILHYPFTVNSLMTDIRIVISDDETWPPFLKYAVEVKKNHPAACAGSAASKRNGHFAKEGSHEWQPSALPGPGHSVVHSTAYLPTTPVPAEDMVEIPLEKTHRRMIIKKAHFVYEDADIKVAAICSEVGFSKGVNKDLDGHLKGQLSEAVQQRCQYRKPDKFDVFTVQVQHAAINCRYLVILNILDRSLGTRHDAHKCLQQIVQAVCQEADTLEMPSVAIAPNTFTVGGFQKGSILPEFIRVISHYRFTNDDFFTDVRFLANQNAFNSLVADAERTVGRVLRRIPQQAKVANQSTMDSSHPSTSPEPPSPGVGGAPVTPPAPVVGGAPVTPPAPVVGGAPVTPPAPVVGGAPVTPPASGMGSSKDTQLPSPGPGMTKLSEHVFFSLACGDLCKVQADAVVVPVAPSLDVKSGVVQAADASSGGAISCAVKQIKKTKQTALEGTAIPVAITSGLNCKQVILMIRNAKAKSEALDHACNEALKLAEGLDARSVTFPPISSNKGKDKLAKCMTGAFASFIPQNPQYTVMVTVVVKENDEATLKAFRSLAGEGTTDQGIDELPHQMNPDGDKFETPPDAPFQSHQEPPGLEDDPNVTDGPGTAV